MRRRNNQILIRLSDDEMKILKNKIKKSNSNQSNFLRNSILKKQIVVINGLDNYLIELKRIGNNLNQLAKAVHMGKVNCKNEMDLLTNEVNNLWQLLKSLKAEKH